MDKRDQELLDKQLRFGSNPPLNQNSAMIDLITVADPFEHAAEEQNAQLLTQWKILGARWLELAAQSQNATEKDPLDDPIPWDHRK